MAFLLIIFTSVLFGAAWLAYCLGPNDSSKESLTRREAHALSFAAGLIMAVPSLFNRFMGHDMILETLVIMASGFLVATLAGRRAFWFSFVTVTLLIGHWFLHNKNSLQHPISTVGQLILNGALLALPSLTLFCIWGARRSRDFIKLENAARSASPVLDNVPVTSDNMATTEARQTQILASADVIQTLTRR